MKWIEIDKDNLPEGEVLVLTESGSFLLGNLKPEPNGKGGFALKKNHADFTSWTTGATHYIDPKNIEMP